MSKDRRIGWLRELKVGDKVAVYRSAMMAHRIEVITKISPIGRMTAGHQTFDPEGSPLPKDRDKYHITRLEEITQDVVDGIREKELRNWARGIFLYKLPLDKLKRIYKIVKEKNDE